MDEFNLEKKLDKLIELMQPKLTLEEQINEDINRLKNGEWIRIYFESFYYDGPTSCYYSQIKRYENDRYINDLKDISFLENDKRVICFIFKDYIRREREIRIGSTDPHGNVERYKLEHDRIFLELAKYMISYLEEYKSYIKYKHKKSSIPMCENKHVIQTFKEYVTYYTYDNTEDLIDMYIRRNK